VNQFQQRINRDDRMFLRVILVSVEYVVSLWWGGVPLKNKRISAEKIFLIKGGLW
jgi:hypothetical protein